MANSTCSITSISDLLEKAHNNLLNVTTTIAACPDICSLAWGKGNPDLSGIGVNISYIMQVVLTIVCCPVLGLVYHFRHRLGIEEDAEDRLMNIHKSFVEVSAGFNIPVGIAAAIRIGSSPIFEQSFLQVLVVMQTYSFCTTVATAFLVFKNRPHLVTLIQVLLIQSLLFLIVCGLENKSNMGWISDQELLKNCKTHAKIMPMFRFKMPGFQYVVWVLVAIFGLGFCFVILFSGNLLRIQTSTRTRERLQSIVSGRAAHIVIAGVTIAATGCMVLLMYGLEVTRSYLRSITGAGYQDDEWGFGQVIAVCLWIPLCFKIIYFAMRVVIHRVAPGFTFIDIWYNSGLSSAGPRWVKINDEREDG